MYRVARHTSGGVVDWPGTEVCGVTPRIARNDVIWADEMTLFELTKRPYIDAIWADEMAPL